MGEGAKESFQFHVKLDCDKHGRHAMTAACAPAEGAATQRDGPTPCTLVYQTAMEQLMLYTLILSLHNDVQYL